MNQAEQEQIAPIIDLDDLMARCLNNIELAQRVIVMFQESSDENFIGIEEAVAAKDTESIAHLAHRLKGASANVAASGLCDQAAELEQAARRCLLAEIPGHLENLRQEWFRFTSEVSHINLSPESTVRRNPIVTRS